MAMRMPTKPASAPRRSSDGGARLPRQRGADGLGLARRARIAGQQLEQRGELTRRGARAVSTIGGAPAGRGMHDERRRAEHAIDARLVAVNLADVVERELVDVAAGDAEEAEVGQQVALAGEAAREPPGRLLQSSRSHGSGTSRRHGNPCYGAACRS